RLVLTASLQKEWNARTGLSREQHCHNQLLRLGLPSDLDASSASIAYSHSIKRHQD
ncbi:hypothetical protein FOZ62_013080, partial [Perkinsus olseni]